MCAAETELRALRMEEFEAAGGAAGLGGGGGGAYMEASAEEVEMYKKKKFVEATSKGMGMKCKAKMSKMKC